MTQESYARWMRASGRDGSVNDKHGVGIAHARPQMRHRTSQAGQDPRALWDFEKLCDYFVQREGDR